MRKAAKRAGRLGPAFRKTPQNDLRKITTQFHFPDQK